jgi:hypothetical protein
LPVPPEGESGQTAEAAAEKAAAEEAKAREEADSTLKATVKAYRKGEHAYRAGLLESGRLADQYLHQRMAPPISDKRAPAVQTLEGELAKWSSTAVDANRLIGCFHAWRLLADEPGLPKAAESIPYGHYRDAWVQLVQRVNKDTPQESWILLPGIEAEAQALFADCTQHRRSKEAVQDGVKGLLRAKVERDAEEAQAQAEKAAVAAREQAQAALKARAEVEAAAQATAAAEKAASEATESERAALTEAAERAKEELLAKQKAAALAAEKAAAEEATKSRAQAEAKAAREAAAKAAEKAAKATAAAAEKAQRRAEAQGSRQPAMQAIAKAGTAKDVAAMAVELITGHDAPDDVLTEFLRQVKSSGHCSKLALRAIDAALVVLCRPPTSPVPASGVNQLAAAA